MTTSGAYDSLQRMLSPGTGPTSPPAVRKPIPAFSLEPHLPAVGKKASRQVVSPSLDWWKMKEVLELEYKHGGRALPLLQGNRTVLQTELEASSTLSRGVRLDILSDALLVSREKGEIELFTAERMSFKDDALTLHHPPSPSSPPAEEITLLTSPSLPSLLSLLARTFPSRPPPPPSSPPPPSPSAAANWTPDSSLLLCECCSTVRFNTLTQREVLEVDRHWSRGWKERRRGREAEGGEGL